MKHMTSVHTETSSDSNNMGTSADNNRAIQDNLYTIQEYNLQTILQYLNIISYNSEMHDTMHSEMHNEMLSKMLCTL